MLLVLSNTSNPYFNIACEEYLLKEKNDDFFYIYINNPSIIIGKHQNTFAEINSEFVRDNNIPVIRRISGGGTVYHDNGNINFSFIINKKRIDESYFKYFTNPIMNALKGLGLDPEYSNRNDLLLSNKKFSGNAEHIWKDRLMHHGTLLFSSNLFNLENAINSQYLNYKDKSVKSFRSRVINISELNSTLNINVLKDELINSVNEVFTLENNYFFSDFDIEKINVLVDTKYCKNEWNLYYSPPFTKLIDFFNNTKAEIYVVNGLIESICFYKNEFTFQKTDISDVLLGKKFDENVLKSVLADIPSLSFCDFIDKEKFISRLFN